MAIVVPMIPCANWFVLLAANGWSIKDIKMDEKTALVRKDSCGHLSLNKGSNDYHSTRDIQHQDIEIHKEKDMLSGNGHQVSHGAGGVNIARTMGLPSSILLMVNCCCGSGIFVSPVAVTASVGSVGLSLIIWAFCGLYSMVLALCYAEIGTAIPRAGGDYTYIEVILGPLPAFLSLWLMLIISGPMGGTILSRTTAEYFSYALELEYDRRFVLVCSIFLVGKV